MAIRFVVVLLLAIIDSRIDGVNSAMNFCFENTYDAESEFGQAIGSTNVVVAANAATNFGDDDGGGGGSLSARGGFGDNAVNAYDVVVHPRRFTKELRNWEYAIRKRFKGLHCCAKDYRSIEWLKDGKPYPWAQQLSHLILYPQSGNQTIFGTMVDFSDSGNYTCIVKYENEILAHTIELFVLDQSPNAPKMTHVPNDMEVFEGQSTRLFCEAFIGLNWLPDQKSGRIQWFKVDENSEQKSSASSNIREKYHPATQSHRRNSRRQHQHHNWHEIGRADKSIRIETVAREQNRTLGSYLQFEYVSRNDFGTYVCRISNSETFSDLYVRLYSKDYQYGSHEFLADVGVYGKVVIMVLLVIFLLVTLNITILLVIRLLWGKASVDCTTVISDNSKCSNNTLFCYSSLNSQWVFNTLFPMIGHNTAPTIRFSQLSTTFNTWGQRLLERSDSNYRRICMLVSSDTVRKDWQTDDYLRIVKQLSCELQKPLVIIVISDLPSFPKSVVPDRSTHDNTVSILHFDAKNLFNFYVELNSRLK